MGDFQHKFGIVMLCNAIIYRNQYSSIGILYLILSLVIKFEINKFLVLFDLDTEVFTVEYFLFLYFPKLFIFQ